MFSSRPHEQSKANLIGITAESDGFFLKKLKGGTLSNGDILLISYKARGSDWHKTEVVFEENSGAKGMFITTGTRPVEIIVALKALVEAARTGDDVPVTVHRTIPRNAREYSRTLSHSTLRKLASDDTYTSNPFYGRRNDNEPDFLHHYLNGWHGGGVFDTSFPSFPRTEHNGGTPVPEEALPPQPPPQDTGSPFPVQDSPPGSFDLRENTLGNDFRAEISGVGPASENPFEITDSGAGGVPLGEPGSIQVETSGAAGLGQDELGDFGGSNDEPSPFGGESKDDSAPAGLDSADQRSDTGSSSTDPAAYN